MCALQKDTAKVISSMLLVSGISTLLHCFFGSRLPLIQGASFVYLAPVLYIIFSPEFVNLDKDVSWLSLCTTTPTFLRKMRCLVQSFSFSDVTPGPSFAYSVDFASLFTTQLSINPSLAVCQIDVLADTVLHLMACVRTLRKILHLCEHEEGKPACYFVQLVQWKETHFFIK